MKVTIVMTTSRTDGAGEVSVVTRSKWEREIAPKPHADVQAMLGNWIRSELSEQEPLFKVP